MRRIMLVPILLGVFFMLGAIPATAGATNCTFVQTNPITRQTESGYQTMKFLADVGYCTSDTLHIKFRWLNSGTNDYGPPPGASGYVFHQFYLAGQQQDVIVPATQSPFYSEVPYSQTCWYGSGVLRIQKSTFQYAISNLSDVYGSWHTYTRNVQEGITC